MSIINLKEKTINAKIVYYGTALGGKTTSLKHVHRVIDPDQKIELVSLNTDKDRTLFFDFLPISLGKIGDFTVKLQGFTVPGQVKYNLTRKYVLTGADAVVLVTDSQRTQLEHNVAALKNLKENLEGNGLDYQTIPLVIQFNKRDVADPVSVAEMMAALNDRGCPAFETVATTGIGVFESFIDICRQMMDHIAGQYRIDDAQHSIGEVMVRNLTRIHERALEDAPVVVPIDDTQISMPIAGPAVEEDDEDDDDERTAGIVMIPGGGAEPDDDDDELPLSEDLLRKAVDSNIEIARLYSEVNETKNRLSDRVRELAALNEVGKTMTSELDVDRLLQTVVDSATSCLGTEFGSLMLLNRSGDGLIEKVVKGYLRDPLAQTTMEGGSQPLLIKMALEGEPILVTEHQDSEVLGLVRGLDDRVQSLIVVPLTLKEAVVGVIVVYFHGGEEASRDKLRYLSALASHAVIAIENARLVARIEGFNRELEQTVRERTAELRKAYEELKELDRLKDDFLSSMSHELLTPLTSIQSFSEILVEMNNGEGGEAQEFLEIINRESIRLTKRLKDLLDLSQLEGGNVSFDEAPVNLRDILQDLFASMAEDFRVRGIKAVVMSPPSIPKASCDRRWMARALESLLSNAVKFSEEGAEVKIEFSTTADDEVVVSVQDTGAGIDPRHQSIVFERFKQIGDLLTDKPTGVGLGLPLAKEIVTTHGGRIWLTSKPGKGSTFSIALPIAEETASTVRTEDPAHA